MTDAPAPLPPSRLRVWLLAARVRTLPAAAAPVLIGGAMAAAADAFHLAAWGCALLGALLIQVGTNFWNDVHDFHLGADANRVGPMRVTQAGLVTPNQTRTAALIAFALAVLAGVYLMVRGGWPLALIGFSGLLCGWLYTAGRRSLAYLGIADAFVLVYFGPVAVGGTYYVQAVGNPEAISVLPVVLVAGLAPGLLSVAILVANNLRDAASDHAVGKKTLIVRFGYRFGRRLYATCVLGGTLVLPLLLVVLMNAPPTVLLGCLALAWARPPLRRVYATEDPVLLMPVLGATARVLLVFSLLFGLGWLLPDPLLRLGWFPSM